MAHLNGVLICKPPVENPISSSIISSRTLGFGLHLIESGPFNIYLSSKRNMIPLFTTIIYYDIILPEKNFLRLAKCFFTEFYRAILHIFSSSLFKGHSSSDEMSLCFIRTLFTLNGLQRMLTAPCRSGKALSLALGMVVYTIF